MLIKRPLVACGLLAFIMALPVVSPVLANGQGVPIEPAPEETPVVLEPAGPAPAESVQAASEGTNWWLIGLGAAAVVGLVVLFSDDAEDDTRN